MFFTQTGRTATRRVQGVLAATAVVGFAGAAAIAPLSSPSVALADEAFYERIHQEFVPADVAELSIHLEPSTAEELPPEPEPEPEPEEATSSASSAAAAAPAAVPLYTGGGSPAEWMAAAGIPESDWGYVDFIVSKESGWNPNATNSSSGACGLVQAYPCSKVPGSGYNPIDNLRWANGYAAGRYGSWAAAYSFWSANRWW